MTLLKGNLFVAGPAGRIEAILKESRTLPPTMLAIVSHPLPTGGGTMHNKLVYRMTKALGELGGVTLRYNFRGVGKSDGQFESGRGEQADLKAVIEYAASRFPHLPLVLGGFSFGAWISLKVAASEPRVRAMVLTGLPVARFGLDFARQINVPMLIIQGTRDEFGPIEGVRRLAEATGERVQLFEIEGGDHFLGDHLHELSKAINHFFANRPSLV